MNPSLNPNRRQALGMALGAVLAPAAGTALAARSEHAALLHERAVGAFRAGRFPEAYGRFMRLADLGDSESARMALWMYQRGPTLFGRQWDATPEQISDWTAHATRRGQPPLS